MSNKTLEKTRTVRRIPLGILNTFSSLLLQVVTIVSGFIIPRLILRTFGSETNGLVGSISQFLNYINLLEGGLNGVIMASLYKPIANKDDKKISSIAVTSTNFFRKISLIFVAYSIILSIVYPLFVKSNFDFGFVCSLTLILSIKLFAQYCFSLTNKNLLDAARRGYIIYFAQTALLVLETIMAFIAINVFPSIHVLKLISGAVYLLQPVIFNVFVKKYFTINKAARRDNQLISDRWNGLAINIAAFIHNNTDIVILTVLLNLQTVSIYNVYALVTTGLRKLIQAVSNAIAPSFGNLYARGNKKELNEKFDMSEYVIFMLSFFMFGIGMLLITPFVMLYTDGVKDADYYQPLFGLILLAAELISVIRAPALRLAYGAGKFKDLTGAAIIETSLNIVVSLSMVFKFGIVGVAIGTFVAMGFRTFWQNYYLRNHLINRPYSKFLKRFAVFAIIEIALVFFCAQFIPELSSDMRTWVAYVLVICVLFMLVYGVISIIFFKDELMIIKRYIRGKGHEKAS